MFTILAQAAQPLSDTQVMVLGVVGIIGILAIICLMSWISRGSSDEAPPLPTATPAQPDKTPMDWFQANYASLPKGEFVAVTSTGMIAHNPNSNVLIGQLPTLVTQLGISMRDVAIIHVPKEDTIV